MSINPNSPFKIGMVYKTKGGEDVIIIGEHNADNSYHTVVGHDLSNRYTRDGDTGRCTGCDVDNSSNLVPGTGRPITEMPAEFIWSNWLAKMFDAIETICELTGIDYVMAAHVPSEKDPNRCFGYAGLNDDAPETMKKMLELMQSRPAIEDHLTPSSSCDTDSVNS